MAEAVAVGVRVRPFSSRERAMKAECCIEMDGQQTILKTNDKENVFTFDESFWSHDGFIPDQAGQLRPEPGSRYADQRKVFDIFGQRVLENAWEGFHCCLFAYGQTGAGKSYSMVGDASNPGLVPIACEEIFHRIEKNTEPHKSYEITASMVELYNEAVQDLLILPQDRPLGGLTIHESRALGVFVDGVRKIPVESFSTLDKLIKEASEHRTIGSTLMNATSSRAHTVLTIEFKQVERDHGTENVKLSMINLVDLAGSEKVEKAGTVGNRLKEGSAINKSLSALGNVIEKLAKKSSGKKKAKDIVVPYRDSKLTRLLQNALGGSSKTIMICALSPAVFNAQETLSTLRFADRAKQIKNVARVNEDPQGKLIREIQEENAKLQVMLAKFQNGQLVDVDSFKEKQEELVKTKKLLEEMERSFEEKQNDSKRVDLEMHERGRTRVMSLIKERKLPHMVNINEDILLSGKLVYCFEEGKTTSIGQHGGDHESDSDSGSTESSDSEEDTGPPDIALAGEDVFTRQAYVTNNRNVCHLYSAGQPSESTFVNGASVSTLLAKKRKLAGRRSRAASCVDAVFLEHGDRLVFGVRVHMIFVFILPEHGSAEQLINTGSVNYAMARRELRMAFLRRMRGLGMYVGDSLLKRSCSHKSENTADSDSCDETHLLRHHSGCRRCLNELDRRMRETQSLQEELATVRASLETARKVAGEAHGLQLRLSEAQMKLAKFDLGEAGQTAAGRRRSNSSGPGLHHEASPESDQMRTKFKEALGILDKLQSNLFVPQAMQHRQLNIHPPYETLERR